MKINMGVGTSNEQARYTPTRGRSREHGKDHVPTMDNKYNASEALEYAMDNEKEVRE